MNFIVNETEQKLRGGYYTPLDLAVFITKWVTETHPESLLEPSCGDGVFFQALRALKYHPKRSIVGFELFEEEASKSRARCQVAPSLSASICAQDFLGWAITQMAIGEPKFDAVVGNPPFIRYQYLAEDAQRKAEAIFDLLHLPFTKHTNAWVPFVLASISLLKPGGRFGMILPAEIIHVMHAQSLRTYLALTCSRLLIIDPEEIWFDGTLQGAVILFAEKKLQLSDHSDGLGVVQVRGKEFLNSDPGHMFNTSTRMNGKTVDGKWTRALLSANERAVLSELEEHPDVHRFRDIAAVDVGIVTGANKFFLVDDETVGRFGLGRFSHPMFGRSEHCPGVIYDDRQHAQNAHSGNPTNFIWINADDKSLGASVRRYIQLGEAQELHKRYKCRVRSPWYTVPSVYATEIGMLKRAHDTPRLILNRLGAYTTDTAYRIAVEREAEKLVYCFLNALTALSAELEGRHYGGGVLELVPTEIEKLLVALPSGVRPALRRLDDEVRKSAVASVLHEQTKIVLGPLGLSMHKQEILLSAWMRLKNRRQRTGETEA